MKYTRSVGAAALLVAAAAFAQQSKIEFEVASLKPAGPENGDNGDFRLFWIASGRFVASNATLKQLIEFAWDVRERQISGGPKWVNSEELDSEKYNIEALPDRAIRIPDGFAASDTFRMMVQSLLEDRFRLAVHKESREGKVYELRVAKGGAKLKAAARSGTSKSAGPSGLFPQRGRVEGKAASMSLLARYLSGPSGRVVVDRTGLGGNYDFTLSWAPDPEPGAASDAAGPSLFTALQEQLGIRLEPARAAIDIVVIDRAEKPDRN